MSVFVQEVLGLLRRNFVKTTLNPTDDYFQFVRKGGSRNQSRSRAGGFAPQGQALSISAGSVLCNFTGPNGLGRFVSTVKFSGELAGTIPMFWLRQGQCDWHSLKDSLLSQDTADPIIYVGNNTAPTDIKVSNRVYIPKLNGGAVGDPGRIPFVLPDPNPGLGGTAGELDSNVNFTFKETGSNPPTAMLTVGSGVSSTFGTAGNTPVSVMDIHSNLVLRGEVYDTNVQLGVGPTGGNPPGIAGMLLRSRADGTVQWTPDSSNLPDLQFGELIIGYQNPQPAPGTIVPAVGSFTPGALGKGNPNDVLTAGGPNGFPSWQPNPSIGGSGSLYQIAMFTPDGVTISNSLMYQDGDVFNGPKPLTVTNGIFDPANPGLAGNFINTGKMTLLDVAQEASASTDRILCLFNDPNNPNNPENGQIKFRPANSIGVTGDGSHKRVPLWTPDGSNIRDSLLIQSNDIQPADAGFSSQKLTNDGNFENKGTTELVTVNQNNELDQVLVRDPSNNGLVKWRSALSIGGGTKGWDIVDPDPSVQNGGAVANWDVNLSNGYMELDTTPTNSNRAIRPNNLTNAQEGYFVFVAEAADIPKNYLLFTGVNLLNSSSVRTTWSGDLNAGFPYVPTNLDSSGNFWAKGTAVKFHYILRIDPQGNQVIWWDACCEVKSTNTCPIATSTNFITPEDTVITGLSLPASDAEGDPLTWIVVTQPPVGEGTLSVDTTTGLYTFTPAANWYGTGSFTWKVNDGACDSNIATVTYNVTAQCDSPIFAVSNGIGNPCGAASTAPAFTGVIGDSYTWTGDVCDIDNPASDITFAVFHSLDNGATFNSGFGTQGGSIVPDPSNSQFTFNITNVNAGITLWKIKICDDVTTCCTEYIFPITLITNKLDYFELQVISQRQNIGVPAPYNTHPTSLISRTPYQAHTNLGVFNAVPQGPFQNTFWGSGSNWNMFGNKYPSSTPYNFVSGPGPFTTSYWYQNATWSDGGGTGYSLNAPIANNIGDIPPAVATTTAITGGGTGLKVRYTHTNGVINPNSVYMQEPGTGYSPGDKFVIDGNPPNGVDLELTVPADRFNPAVTTQFPPVTGAGADAGTQAPAWGNFGDVKGKMLTNRSSVPTNMNNSGIVTNVSKVNISPSGGTYAGIAGGATFQLVNMVVGAQYVNAGDREIFVFADQIPANSNVAVGQTIIFSAATLNAAFASEVSAGFAFTGDLICTIEEEDINYAPLATNSIGIQANLELGGKLNNNNAYKLFVSVTDATGAKQTYFVRRYNLSNMSIHEGGTDQRFTLDTWAQPDEYMNGSSTGREWLTPQKQPSFGDLNRPYIIDKQYIDTTKRGSAKSNIPTAWNAPGYISDFPPAGGAGGAVWWAHYWDSQASVSGISRLSTSLKNLIASNSADGKIEFKIIGDTWVNAKIATNVLRTFNTLVAGSGYSVGTYSTICPDGDTDQGQYATVNVTQVSGTGEIQALSVLRGGGSYAAGQILEIVGGNNDASITADTVDAVGTEGTVTVNSVDANGKILTATLTTSGDQYWTAQGDDRISTPPPGGVGNYTQVLNVPAEFRCTGGSGDNKAQVRFNISGTSLSGAYWTNIGSRAQGNIGAKQYVKYPGQSLTSVDFVTKGGSGYSVGDVLTVSGDSTWVASTSAQSCSFQVYHQQAGVATIGTPSGSVSGYFTATNVPTEVNGLGRGCTVDIVINGGALQSLVINTQGTGYVAGDIISVKQNNFTTLQFQVNTVTSEQESIGNTIDFNDNFATITMGAFGAGDGRSYKINVFNGQTEVII